MNDTTTTLAIGHRTIPLDPPRPPRKPDMLLWIDTETTGVDPYQCELTPTSANSWKSACKSPT